MLTHDDLRQWRACERRFWLSRQRRAPAPGASPSAQATGELAVVRGPAHDAALRASFPGAVVIDTPGTPAEWAQAVQRSAALLSSDTAHDEGWAILGACLASRDGAQVRIDVVMPGEHGLRLFKLRYATVGDEADVDAVALWTHVASHAGWRVQSVALLLVDIDFVYPGHGCYAGLFREVDLGPVLGSRPVADWLTAMHACERGPQPVPLPVGPQCLHDGGCEFAGECHPGGETEGRSPSDPLASLEVVGRELAAELRDEGHADLRSVPLRRLSNPRHRRAALAIQQRAPVLEPVAAELMRVHSHPRHLLRFDTIGFAVPIWPGTRPYQVLPFQWTCDVETAPGVLERHGFLADAQGDPRRAFAVSLLQVLGERGPVFAYNAGFERNRIRELALHFGDLALALEAVLPRIVDLFQLARGLYYHPAMRGSWSFKAICRAVAPDLQADRFEWSGEPSAQAAFAHSLQRGLDAETVARLRAALQAHGRQQAEVLRRIVALFDNAPT